jgi:hypothetical protein
MGSAAFPKMRAILAASVIALASSANGASITCSTPADCQRAFVALPPGGTLRIDPAVQWAGQIYLAAPGNAVISRSPPVTVDATGAKVWSVVLNNVTGVRLTGGDYGGGNATNFGISINSAHQITVDHVAFFNNPPIGAGIGIGHGSSAIDIGEFSGINRWGSDMINVGGGSHDLHIHDGTVTGVPQAKSLPGPPGMAFQHPDGVQFDQDGHWSTPNNPPAHNVVVERVTCTSDIQCVDDFARNLDEGPRSMVFDHNTCAWLLELNCVVLNYGDAASAVTNNTATTGPGVNFPVLIYTVGGQTKVSGNVNGCDPRHGQCPQPPAGPSGYLRQHRMMKDPHP